ncbi:MAG: DUF3500 domain-containing protein [Armatimonadetes bacterium]|nr:DUF3500 domain-containing protein [Armatimonadota bacterium]
MKHNPLIRILFGVFVALLLTLQLCSCGGGSKASGAASLSITWPDQSRLIPVAANSITVAFLNGSTTVASQTVARPSSGNQSTVSFSSLPATSLTLTAKAFPSTDGSGTAQASASQSVTITADSTTSVTLTMASTISTLSLSPNSPSVAAGSSTTLTLSAKDSSGATVITSDSTMTWTSSNTSVATVAAGGVVTGVAAGTSTITVTDSESGKSASVTATVTSSGTTIVDLANAYINSLSSTQQAAVVVSASATNAAKWSNLPATPASDGTNTLRNGVSYSSLTTAQKTAFINLVQAAIGTNGYDQWTQIRASDNYLGASRSGYSGDYQYVAFVGTPSTSGNWLLQIGGHHNAHNYYYTGNTLDTTTPYFLGVEPQTFTYNSTSYTPLLAQRNGMYNLVNSLTSTQLTSAKLTSSFSDVYLGPGKDARSNFPTGTSGRGILASSLTSTQQTLLKTAIAAWVDTSAEASTYQLLYESELASTYVAYSGTTTFNSQGDYVRIDGPHVWIEFVCQNGVVFSGIHFHTVWRDRVTDYNADFGF